MERLYVEIQISERDVLTSDVEQLCFPDEVNEQIFSGKWLGLPGECDSAKEAFDVRSKAELIASKLEKEYFHTVKTVRFEIVDPNWVTGFERRIIEKPLSFDKGEHNSWRIQLRLESIFRSEFLKEISKKQRTIFTNDQLDNIDVQEDLSEELLEESQEIIIRQDPTLSVIEIPISKYPSDQTLPKIYLREDARKFAWKHALEDRHLETGGVLLGRFIQEKENQTAVIVTGIVRGLYTDRRSASLTFKPETWAQILRRIDMDEDYADERLWAIVGWYHTHPNWGIFLSGHDKFIHENYFTRPEHIALVIDPMREKEGFFCWNLKQTEVIPHRYEILSDDEIKKRLGIEDDLPTPEILENGEDSIYERDQDKSPDQGLPRR